MTVVFVHAHPDDEATSTAGSMILASRQGIRVVVVYATGGEHGTVPADLPAGRTVADHRRDEAMASASVTGAARVEWLGYSDSGMHGWEQNGHDGSFHGADVDEAAGRLAAILDEEQAQVLVGYDWHGGYGHPDHVQVHRVAHRAAELATRRPRLLESTMNRDAMREHFAQARAMGIDPGWDVDEPMADGNPIGLPQREIHHRVDVSSTIADKRRALECHSSQEDVQGILAMPEHAFAVAFGTEYYAEPGAETGMVDGFPFG
ncbi:PIG-L family deacetylase [Yimella sp. cx-51]|uniref:PIG-L family deacetylase n=1 Tax=Yimella sp. cx-51 TaxID=2770551 RepID=UPI00165DA2F0|nr:PIG-L family deacetylase [Yimella sp. cx-51]MBC9956003.1 PIG-L family deacetylase [Yimella sp. cx-51]QTH37459.1 PIG-L family deacetylase [Yimella sp. cx-51]